MEPGKVPCAKSTLSFITTASYESEKDPVAAVTIPATVTPGIGATKEFHVNTFEGKNTRVYCL